MTPRESQRMLRTVAGLEALKGTLVIVAGVGLVELVHVGAQGFAESLVAHLHLNPASHYPRIFIDAFGALTPNREAMLAAGAAAYVLLRFVEAYGLWTLKSWGRAIGIASGALYIPFEIWGLFRGEKVVGLVALVINVIVVVGLWYSHVAPKDASA